ncbi:MAG: hypothetical protein ACRC1H_03405, partial [Caldilineaceae bacterium]
MASRVFAALMCGLVLLFSSIEASAQKALVRDDLRNEAIRLETDFRRLAPNAASRPAQAWRADAAAALRGGNNRGALAAAAAAVLADPRDGANWLGFAQTALGVADATQDWSERYTSRDRATAAAYAAYER